MNQQGGILKRNKEIAKYLGYNVDGYWWHHTDSAIPSLNESICSYHESWDGLMYVVEKISEELCYDTLDRTIFYLLNRSSRKLTTLNDLFLAASDYCIAYNKINQPL